MRGRAIAYDDYDDDDDHDDDHDHDDHDDDELEDFCSFGAWIECLFSNLGTCAGDDLLLDDGSDDDVSAIENCDGYYAGFAEACHEIRATSCPECAAATYVVAECMLVAFAGLICGAEDFEQHDWTCDAVFGVIDGSPPARAFPLAAVLTAAVAAY